MHSDLSWDMKTYFTRASRGILDLLSKSMGCGRYPRAYSTKWNPHGKFVLPVHRHSGLAPESSACRVDKLAHPPHPTLVDALMLIHPTRSGTGGVVQGCTVYGAEDAMHRLRT
jgi:hypothetical protein